jgi:hypothetical protein
VALYLHALIGGAPQAYVDRALGYSTKGSPLFRIDGLTAFDSRTGKAAYAIDGVYFHGLNGNSDLYFDPSEIDHWMIDELFAGSPWREHLESFSEKAEVERVAEVFPEYVHLFEDPSAIPAEAIPAEAMPADAPATPFEEIMRELQRKMRPPPKNKPFLQRFWDALAHLARWRS